MIFVKNLKILAVKIFFITASSIVSAGGGYDPKAISPHNVNLTADKFFSALISKDENENNAAKLYLLGVMDSSEGVSWCGYETYKTIAICEVVYEGFKQLEDSDHKKKASLVINQILSKNFSC